MKTLQPNVAAALSITYFVALIAFTLRMYVRTFINASFLAGDWISAVAFVRSSK